MTKEGRQARARRGSAHSSARARDTVRDRNSTVAEAFDSLRPLMFSIAYRMLGTVSEAEDVVQEAFLRYQRAVDSGAEIESQKSYVSAVVTRLAIDELRSARARRESYVGQWLPEPLLTDESENDPAAYAEQSDSLSMAFLLLLERLTPVERAVFLLHDVFGYGYEEISEIVRKSETNCRQIAARARKHLAEGRPRFDVSRRERDDLGARFFAALSGSDVGGLVEMLSAEAVVYGDGGGKAPQWSRPIVGAERVANLLANVGRGIRNFNLSLELCQVNGQPGAVVRDPEGSLVSVFVLEITDRVVTTFRSVINPDKLQHLGPVSGITSLSRVKGGRT